MLIVRSPVRISFGGGGTDLPSYYEKFSGFLIAAAINKYVYITVNETFQPEFIVKYSHLERTRSVGEIVHPIVRESLQAVGLHEDCYLEITSMEVTLEGLIAVQAGAGTPGQIAERLAGLLADGMSDYICFMLPTGDMTMDEAKRTLDLFVTEVQPQLAGLTVSG